MDTKAKTAISKMITMYLKHSAIDVSAFSLNLLDPKETKFFEAFASVQFAENLVDGASCFDDRMRCRCILMNALGDLERLMRNEVKK